MTETSFETISRICSNIVEASLIGPDALAKAFSEARDPEADPETDPEAHFAREAGSRPKGPSKADSEAHFAREAGSRPKGPSKADPEVNSEAHGANWCTPSRKTGRNQYSIHLRNINTILYRINKAKLCTPIIEHSVVSNSNMALKNARAAKRVMTSNFDRVVLKLTKREETKFTELLQCFASDTEFNSYEKIMQFSRSQYILDRGIVSDVDVLNNAEQQKSLQGAASPGRRP